MRTRHGIAAFAAIVALLATATASGTDATPPGEHTATGPERAPSGKPAPPRAPSPSTLLERYVPHLRYDSREEVFATSPQPSVGGSRRRDVVRGRIVLGRDQRIWLQYWSFYASSTPLPGLRGTVLGSALERAGEWEAVHVRLDEFGRRPDYVVYSQDTGSEARPWDAIELDDGHPVLYPGLGSHAGLFTAGCDPVEPAEAGACTDGDGRAVTPDLEPLDRACARRPGSRDAATARCARPDWHDPALPLL